MEKSKLLQVIAAIMITSMAVSILSFSTTTVSATSGTATLLPSSARANTRIMFTVTVTNTSTADNIDNVRVYFTSGFSTPVAYSASLENAAGDIENAVPYIQQAGENLKLAEDNKKSSASSFKQAAENLNATIGPINYWALDNLTGSNNADENVSNMIDNMAKNLNLLADAIDNDYENLVPYVKTCLTNVGNAMIRASGWTNGVLGDGGADNMDNWNDNAGRCFYTAGEHLNKAAALFDNGDLENIGLWIENAGNVLSWATFTNVSLNTSVWNAAARLSNAGLKLVDAGNFVDNAGYALDISADRLLWAAENLCAVTGLGTNTAGDNAGDNLRFVARYIDNAGMAFRDAYSLGWLNADNVDNIYRAGENLKLASYSLENVAFLLGVDLGKDNDNAARAHLKYAGDNLANWAMLNLTTAGTELVSMGTNLLAGAAKMLTTASSLTPITWTMSSGTNYVDFSSIGDNIIALAGSQTFKFLWTTPNITTDTNYPLSVLASKEEIAGDHPYPNWENLGGFTVRIDGAVPTVRINVTQTGVATPNLVGTVLDNARATITIVASEVLSSIDNVYIMNSVKGENILPPILGSSFTSTDSITWTYQYLTVDNWDDNFTWVRLSKATDLSGNENTDIANDNIGMENSLIVDTRAPVFADNGLTGIRTTMVENRVQPGTGTVYKWLDNTALKNLYIVVGDNLGVSGKDTRVTSVTVNGSSTTKNSVTDNLWTTSMTLPEGYTAAIVVTATDSTGNAKSENLENIFVDTQFPQISFDTITRKSGPVSWTENGILINDNTPTIKIIVTDPGYPTTGWGVARDNLKVCFDNDDNIGWLGAWFFNNPYSFENLENNVSWIASISTGIFENTIDNLRKGLVSGTYWINVMATDNLQHGDENKKIASRSFTLDVTAPTWTQTQLQAWVTVKDPATSAVLGATTKKTSWLIAGGAKKPGSTINVYVGASIATATLNDTATASTTLNANNLNAPYDYSLTIALSEGVGQNVYIEEIDTASNTSGLVLLGTYTVDATPPVIVLSAPAVDTTTDAAQITVSGTITDALVTDPQILGVTIDCTGASVTKTVYLNADGSFETTVPLVEGNNVINVVAVDGAVTATSGNQTVTTRTVTRSVTPLTTYAIILVVVALILAAIAIFRKEMK